MSWQDKVVWSEGLFLRPQLFQQQERYLEHFAHQRALPLTPFFWGFSAYEIDQPSLAFGKLVLKQARGVFADGTPFDLPGLTPAPPPLTIRPEHQEEVICLAVPLRLPEAEETIFADQPGALARYLAFDEEVRDSNAIGLGPKPVQLAALRLRLLPERELTQSWIGIPLARIHTLRADGAVTLHDADHIPPLTAYGASPLLRDWVTQLHGLARLRADALAARLAGSDGHAGESAEVADYLLLQVLNRYEPLLQHLLQITATAPAELYLQLLLLSGELSTYVRPQTRRPLPALHYNHARLFDCIKPLVDDIHQLLNQVLLRGAQSIALDAQAHGIFSAHMMPAELAGYASLVLAVSARMPGDLLQQQFSAQVKVGPPQRLPELIRAHLPGLALLALPVPPRQIPFNAGFIYFELSRNNALWAEIAEHGGLALHVGGQFPVLRMELWGVRKS